MVIMFCSRYYDAGKTTKIEMFSDNVLSVDELGIPQL